MKISLYAPWDQCTPDVTNITSSKRVENQQVDDIADNELADSVSWKQKGERGKTTLEWLSNLSRNFESIVLGGMSASLWDEVTKTLLNNGELKGKQNQAVINSVNHHLFQFIGRQRPESSLSRYVYLPGGNYF